MSFPELKTNRLSLTRILSSDVEAIFALFSNPDVIKFYDLDAFTERSQAEKIIGVYDARFEASSGIRWAIRKKKSNELIGTCGYNSWSGKMRNATIGYDLRPEYWGMGLTTEAVREILRKGFSGGLPCGSLHRIQADTIPGNVASEKMLIKLGFKEEGVRRESAYIHGRFVDMKCFGLLKREFRET
jgi:ribosomal-protein-alanine N-acetyltransferase